MVLMQFAGVWTILKTAVVESDKDSVPRLGAALAFYSLFSLAPVLYVVLTVTTVVFEQDAALAQIRQQIARVIGPDGASAVAAVMGNTSVSLPNGPEAIVTVLAFIFGLTAVFNALLGTLNQIWGIEESNPSLVWRYVRRRLIALGLVVLVGALALTSLILTTLLSGMQKYFPDVLAEIPYVPRLTNTVVSLVLLTVLIGIIYRVVPDAPLRWRDVLVGAAVTSLLFTLGTLLIGIYIGRASVGSAFGTAGSVVLLLFWVYYSAQVFLFGAEVTHAYGMYRNGKIETNA
jgi:membrane protein